MKFKPKHAFKKTTVEVLVKDNWEEIVGLWDIGKTVNQRAVGEKQAKRQVEELSLSLNKPQKLMSETVPPKDPEFDWISVKQLTAHSIITNNRASNQQLVELHRWMWAHNQTENHTKAAVLPE